MSVPSYFSLFSGRTLKRGARSFNWIFRREREREREREKERERERKKERKKEREKERKIERKSKP